LVDPVGAHVYFGTYTSPGRVVKVGPAVPPGPPRDVTGTPAHRSVEVRWARPASNGGAAITRYRVQAEPGGRTCTTDGVRRCTVTGLTNGTSYTFQVRARNGAGWGPWSPRSPAVVPRR
jgi:hypothetical protein